MTLLIDLDGVVCSEEQTFERSLAKPIPGAREALLALREHGHTLVIYSARSWSEFRMTKKWLEDHGIPFDSLLLGKPVADLFIDDRAVHFTEWSEVLQGLPHEKPGYAGGPSDEGLLRILREETRRFLELIALRTDLLEPILEVGPMSSHGPGSGVFQRMPETFVDSRDLFSRAGKKYLSVDIDASPGVDILSDFTSLDKTVEEESIGTSILLSCLEHMPRLWDVPRVLHKILKKGGRAFMLTRWNLSFHGPRPDCWRISDDGYHALFDQGFAIESLEKIECPGRPLSPVGIKCVVRKD